MKNRYLLHLAVFLLLNQTSLYAQTLPTNIAGANLKLWLDASDVNNGTANPADASSITTWYDKSGLSHNATVLSGQSGGKVYAAQINGKSVVRFTRTSAFVGSVYQVAGVDIRATASSAVTVFTVYKQGAQGGSQGLWGNDNGNWDRFFMTTHSPYGGDNGLASLGPTYSGTIVTGAGVVGVTRLLTAVYNYGLGNGSAIYFNGQTVITFTDQTSLTDAQTNLRIGWDGDDNCYNGDIAEMIVYNTQLTACEIQQVNRYLGAKYGVSFSTVSINAGGATAIPEGGSVTLSSSVTGTSYQWLLNGTAIPGAVTNSYDATTPGAYKVAVTNSCIDTSAAVTVTNTTMITPGNALNFDGVNDYVDCASTSMMTPNISATDIKTMECWAKLGSLTGDQEILSKSTSGIGIEMLLFNNNLAFYVMNGNDASFISYPASNLSTGKWYHLAVSWDGSTKESMRMYVNGVSVGTRTDVGNLNSVGVGNYLGGTFKIGQWSGSTNRNFFGTIDEVRLWKTQRSQANIRANMGNIVSPGTDMIAYYKFDLGTAGGTNSSTTWVYDVSGNGYKGVLSTFALNGNTSNWVESYAMVAPATTAATGLGSTGFTANWTAPAVGTVTNYLLDVSTDSSFSSFVPGYNALNAGAGTSYAVNGLLPATTYYYRVRADKASVNGQGGYLASTAATTMATLPVTLIDFTAKQQNGAVLLQWNTASELNSARFSVERSSNGNDFTRVATIQAAGTSSALRHYAASDKAPGKGVNYYRLVQVDKDGNFSYSAIQQVVFNGDKSYTVLYPSPAIDHFTIETNDAAIAGTTGMISDMQGKIVKKFTVSGSRQQVDISALAKGIYHVQLADKTVFRIVKE